jgi:phage-related protein
VSDKVTRVLLEIMAIDKATTVLKTMMNSLQGWADTMNGVGAKTELTSEELEIAQVRLQGASDAQTAALEAQAAALGKLEAAQATVAEQQAAEIAYIQEATLARQEAAAANAADAADLLEYAAAAEKAAAQTAIAVKASVDEQVAAYDKLMAADALVAKRSQQVADAQIAAGEEGAAATSAGLGKVGPIMLATGAAAAFLAVKTTKMAADFQTSIVKLVTSAGESKSAMDLVSAGVLNVSSQTGISAEELAKALYFVDSAGIHAADSIKVLTAAAKGARDEQADTATVTNALTTILKNYNLSADQSTTVMNEMIQAISLGKMNLQDFAASLSSVLPIAAANNISFQQVGAALATMTAKGMSAQQAADNLAFSIRALQKPNGVAITELGQLGLSATQVQKSLGTGPDGLSNTLNLLSETVLKKMGPSGTLLLSVFNQSKDIALKAKMMFDAMPPSLQKLASSLENGTISAHQWALAIRNLSGSDQKVMQQFATMFESSQAFANQVTSKATPATQTYATAMSNLMGGAAGLNTALMLVSKQGVGDFTTNVQKMDAVAGRANKEVDGWAEVQGTFNQKMSEAKQSLINTGIAIGQVLLPYATKFLDLIMEILTPIGQWISAHKQLIATILAIAGPFLMALGIFMTLTKIMGLAHAAVLAFKAALVILEDTDPIILALTAVIMTVFLMVKYWKQIKEAIEFAWNWIKAHAGETAAALTLLLGPMGLILGAALEIYTHWRQVSAFFSKMWKDISTDTKAAWGAIQGALEKAWNWMTGAWNSTGGKLVTDIARDWEKVSGAVSKEWDRIYGDLSQIWNELVTLWNDTGGRLVSLVSDNWDAIKIATDEVWNPIWKLLKGVFDIITGNTRLFLSFMTTGFRVAWDVIRGVTNLFWDWFTGYLKAGWDYVSGLFRGAWDIIEGLFKGMWDAATTTAKVAWDIITGVINTALDFIKGILQVFIDLVTGKWGKMWSDAQKVFSTVWNDIGDTANKILNKITGFFTKAAGDISSGFISGIESIASGAGKALGDIWNTVTGFFSDAIHWLEQAGKDLIQGLINGIENWASNLWDTLGNLASGILGKIGNFLGLGSPSRITHQYGIYLVEGLVNGINASAGKAANAARGLALGVLAGTRGTLGNITLASAGVGSGGLFAGSAAGSSGRAATNVTLDLRGAQIAGPQSVRWITDQIDKNFVQKVVPTAGVTLRRTGG